MTTPTLSPDADLADADWTKQSWDFPPYGSREFLEAIGGPDRLGEFRALPAYAYAVQQGLIHDDEWVADWAAPSGRPPGKNVHIHIHRKG